MKENLKELECSIIDDPLILKEYASDLSFVNPVSPKFVAEAKNLTEIKGLINWANRTNTPLIPVSSGVPHMRGDTVPSMGGSVIVDLRKMRKIIKVNRKNRVAIVEPGVTFEELIRETRKEGLRPNIPFMPKKTKSVLTSVLEREPVIMPKYHWDISDPLACLEIVFGNGEIFRTGEAAGPGTIEEQWEKGGAQKAPYGPGPVHWHRLIQAAQGTMGIVTWVSIRCELLPSCEEPFFVLSEDLNKLLELCHWLIRMRLVNECFILNSTNLSLSLAETPEKYESIKKDLPSWALFFNVAGYEYFPEERVNSYMKGVKEITKKIGLDISKVAGKISAEVFLKLVQAPSPEPYWKLRLRGGCYEIFFITIYEKLENHLRSIYKITSELSYPSSDIGIYIQPMVQGSNLHCEFDLFYNPEDKKEVESIRDISAKASFLLLSEGAFFSRPYGHLSGHIMEKNAKHVLALKKIKDIFDPKGIMNPGKLCF